MEYLILIIVFGVIAAAIAHMKGRSVIGWFFVGFLFGLIGIIIVAVLPNLKEQKAKEERQELENRRLREQLLQERMKSESFRRHAVQRLDVHDETLGVDTRAAGSALPGNGEANLLPGAAHREPIPIEPPGAEADPAATPPPSPGAPEAGSRQWHYEADGAVVGPIPEAQLLWLTRDGTIRPQTLLWTEELPDWKPAGDIRALQPYLVS